MEKILTELKVNIFGIQVVETDLDCMIRIRIMEHEIEVACIDYSVADIIRWYWADQRCSEHRIDVLDNVFVSVNTECDFLNLSLSIHEAQYTAFDPSHGIIRVSTSAAWQINARVALSCIALSVKFAEEERLMREMLDWDRMEDERHVEDEMSDYEHRYD